MVVFDAQARIAYATRLAKRVFGEAKPTLYALHKTGKEFPAEICVPRTWTGA